MKSQDPVSHDPEASRAAPRQSTTPSAAASARLLVAAAWAAVVKAGNAAWADRLAGMVVLRLTVQSQVRAGMSRARGWGVTGARLAKGNGREHTHIHT